MAHAVVREKRFTAQQWANALGAALEQAEVEGAPDDEHTYYLAVIEALETLMILEGCVAPADLHDRKAAWEEAYRTTPHGQPVMLRR